MCNNNKRNLEKPFRLLVQVVAFSVTVYCVNILLKRDDFSIKSLISCLIPTNYFVILYITLYLISPMINIILCSLNKNQIKRFFEVMMCLFAVWPTFVDFIGDVFDREWSGLSTIGLYGSQWGYSIVNFCLLYITGAYIKYTENEKKVSRKHIIIIITSLTSIIMVWARINDNIGFRTIRSAWEYCNPLVVLLAMYIFKLFQSFNIECLWINNLSKASFSVFLLHSFFLKYFHIEQFVTRNIVFMLIHIVLCVVIIYLACWIIHIIYELISTPIIDLLIEKIPLLKKDIYDL